MFKIFLDRYTRRGVPPPSTGWQVSSYSNPGGIISTCVAVAITPNSIAVKNSNDPNNTTVSFTLAEWDAFVQGVKNNEFDLK